MGFYILNIVCALSGRRYLSVYNTRNSADADKTTRRDVTHLSVVAEMVPEIGRSAQKYIWGTPPLRDSRGGAKFSCRPLVLVHTYWHASFERCIPNGW